MSKYLATFSGKYGDILWSLPTVKCISEMLLGGERVDFAMMPYFRTLVPLIQEQDYIGECFVVPDWHVQHDCYGYQPWQPPDHIEQGYERVWHLGYRCHPGLHTAPIALIDFIADQQGLKLKDPIPFLKKSPMVGLKEQQRLIAYSFNEQYMDLKRRFLNRVFEQATEFLFVDVQALEWRDAVKTLGEALGFVGCRSANNVLAHGVGQKNIFIFEPHPQRNAYGPLGQVFGCPYGTKELGFSHLLSPEQAAGLAVESMRQWKEDKQKELEITNETVAS